jgi:hypothetical protein
MKKLFFELMQVGMGQLDCLSRGPSPEEWRELYELSQREAVAGICYQGAVALFEFGLRAPQDLIIDLMAEAEDIREHSETICAQLADYQNQLDKKGIRSTILSGEALVSYYGEAQGYLRESTAIDMIVSNKASASVPSGMEVNLYDTVWAGHNSIRNIRLEKWMLENADLLYQRQGGLTLPAPTMHAVLYVAYLYNRLLSSDLSMRDLMDYFYILHAANGHFEPFYGKNSTVESVFSHLRLLRFARGVMWLMQQVFGMKGDCLPVEPLESEGRFLLSAVLLDYKVLSHWGHLLMHYSWYDLIKS